MINLGDRLRLSGGYDMDPKWLPYGQSVDATVLAFVPEQDGGQALVGRLDRALQVEGTVGDIVVLKLRYRDAEWTVSETVHVELCDLTPEPLPLGEPPRGVWVESHARYEKI